MSELRRSNVLMVVTLHQSLSQNTLRIAAVGIFACSLNVTRKSFTRSFFLKSRSSLSLKG